MRNIAAVTILAFGLALPGAAFAVQFWTYDLVADCNGWTSNVEIWFREGYTDASLAWTAVVTDGAGAEVQRFTGTDVYPVGYAGFVTFTYGGTFAAPDGADWSVKVDYVLYDYFTDGHNEIPLSLEATVDCAGGGDTQEPVCCFPADWWRRNPASWPTRSLTVGGQVLEAADLQHVLDRPAWGNLGMLLARQLVTARFNTMANGNSVMDAAMDAADTWLGGFQVAGLGRGGAYGKPAWVRDPATVRALIVPLAEFNLMGCPGNPEAGFTGDGPTDVELVEKALAGAVIPEEPVSFGAVKARYR